MFKKGDLVIGKANNPYGITSSNVICLVLKDEDSRGIVKLKIVNPSMNKSIPSDSIGFIDNVKSEYFELYE